MWIVLFERVALRGSARVWLARAGGCLAAAGLSLVWSAWLGIGVAGWGWTGWAVGGLGLASLGVAGLGLGCVGLTLGLAGLRLCLRVARLSLGLAEAGCLELHWRTWSGPKPLSGAELSGAWHSR